MRRRLARVRCASQRAVDGLLLGLEDLRFEVRFVRQIPGAVTTKNGLIKVNDQRVFDAVRREVAVGRPVWESQRLLDQIEQQDSASFVDEFLKDRADQSLAHVFTLLSPHRWRRRFRFRIEGCIRTIRSFGALRSSILKAFFRPTFANDSGRSSAALPCTAVLHDRAKPFWKT